MEEMNNFRKQDEKIVSQLNRKVRFLEIKEKQKRKTLS